MRTIGNCDLSAWLVAPGVCWVQARNPNYARRLSRRSDCKLVATGVAGGFLRTYEFNRGLAWAERLIARYTQNETAPNVRFSDVEAPQSRLGAKEVSAHTPEETEPLEAASHG